MTETELAALCAAITPPDEAARAAAHAHWASLAKPLGGLGALETVLEDAAALTGSAKLEFSHRAVLVLCADNGVVAQGVSQTDSSVTRAVAENLAARRTSVCRMAQTARCEVVPVDMGIAGEPVAGVLDCRIAPGTADFTLGPAMSRAQAVEAVGRGIRLVQEQKKAGVGLLATGEMGIGNTTTSSAVAAVLLGQPVERMTGRGAGLSDAGLTRKVDAIHRGIVRNQPDPADPLDVMAKLGGFDIAGLCGIFLGGALERVPCAGRRLHQRSGGALRRPALPGGGKGGLCQPLLYRAGREAGAGCTEQKSPHHGRPPSGRGHRRGGRHPAVGHGAGRLRWLLFLRRGRHRCLHAAGRRGMLTLVIGGAASGKSAYAESLVLKTGLPRYYLATMQVWDAECAARVEKHRKMRAEKQFETLECPLHLDHLALPGRGTVLLEDLGNLVANELYDPGGAGEHTAKAVLTGLERLAAGCSDLIVVSNEVFSGGADYVGDTAQYLRALAQVNNAFAARADNVCRVVCGLPVYYKGGEKL